MTLRVTAVVAATAAFLALGTAQAAQLPAIMAVASNKVPACVTPGRLSAYLEARNPSLDPRFARIAVDYMRHGEDLELRWDYAFFQMIVETGNLTFRRDVKPRQNNFAGLGATGNGEPGESFPDVSTGVLAHLQHVLLYAGETVTNPVADRTRKVQEWGILKSWQKGMRRPITFSDLTVRWSPGDRGYARTIQAVAERFAAEFCDKPDPRPELVAEARRGRAVEVAKAEPKSESPAAPVTGTAKDNVRQAPDRSAVETAPRSPTSGQGAASAGTRSALGGQVPAGAADATKAPVTTGSTSVVAAASAAPAFKLLNPVPDEPPAPKVEAAPPAAKAEPTTIPPAKTAPASAAAGAGKAQNALLRPSEPGKCRVWTASYGGQKAIIIRAPAGQLTNFTVLEVNEGSEKKEADAYIAVYARGGQMIGEFASQEKALDKAFDLCPEG